uniref:Uncharacterized protein n=1 Tax=Equus asinus TaxID=9793 RepID=A0A8C4MU42_EQUAS
MDWGQTLSLEQPRAADLAFLPLVSRPTQVQAAEQRQRSPGAHLRPGHQVGEPDRGPGAEEGRLGRTRIPVPGLWGGAGSAQCWWIGTGWARRADLRGLGASLQSADRLKPRAFGHTGKCTIYQLRVNAS